jgi:hypothetical protein
LVINPKLSSFFPPEHNISKSKAVDLKTVFVSRKDRKTERQKDIKTERQKDRKTERQKDRKTERQKDKRDTDRKSTN